MLQLQTLGAQNALWQSQLSNTAVVGNPMTPFSSSNNVVTPNFTQNTTTANSLNNQTSNNHQNNQENSPNLNGKCFSNITFETGCHCSVNSFILQTLKGRRPDKQTKIPYSREH